MRLQTLMSESLSLAGRSAVVTGAGRGFGEQIAVELAALGARVAVLDVDEEAAERCAARLRAGGARAIAVTCDVADPEGVEAAFEELRKEIDEVDLLVNNAGIVTSPPSSS